MKMPRARLNELSPANKADKTEKEQTPMPELPDPQKSSPTSPSRSKSPRPLLLLCGLGLLVFLVISSRGLVHSIIGLDGKRFPALDDDQPVPVMGPITARIVIYPTMKIKTSPAEAVAAALDEVRRIDALMSSYKDSSDVGRINHAKAGEYTAVDPLTWRVLMESLRYHHLSEGAFDITFRPLSQLYTFPRDSDKHVRALPNPEKIHATLRNVGSDKILYQREGMRIALKNAGMSIGLGAIAKGFAVDRAIAVLQKLGIENAMVEIGGEVRVIGSAKISHTTTQEIGTQPKSNKTTAGSEGAKDEKGKKDAAGESEKNGYRKWRTGIRNPRSKDGKRDLIRELDTTNCAIATSGDYEKYFEIGDKRYSHIIDPRTGYPVQGGVVSATVISKNSCMQADALATAVSVLGVKKARALLSQFNGIEAWLYYLNPDGTLNPEPVHLGPFPAKSAGQASPYGG